MSPNGDKVHKKRSNDENRLDAVTQASRQIDSTAHMAPSISPAVGMIKASWVATSLDNPPLFIYLFLGFVAGCIIFRGFDIIICNFVNEAIADNQDNGAILLHDPSAVLGFKYSVGIPDGSAS